ncbi:putative polysaccharide biosynthesis protein [Anaerotignum sp. MSJ-24]|uniref:putative polysaccharide biosynthesis protein n=1 Tax=Anaerotignum sp. MSJ-24 TaxID=2841521 RepID=UPI001C122DDF|nr:polysaccharide biosynthesis protein [Anaerotignum sp. MSJ-24]MBU5463889.1 polysaccharide biosynthesis protein [Anaerotignum sp. MSJ-24]
MSAKKTNKDKKGSFIIQASVLAAASLIVRFIGFLYRLPLTELIGDRGNAIYSAGYYIYTFLLILSSAGLPAAISRLVSTRIAKGEYRNAQKIFRVSMIFAGVAGAIGMLVLFFFAEPIAKMVDSPNSVYCLQTLAPTLLIVGVMSVYRGYLQGMNIMTPTAVSQIFEQVFNAVFSVYLAWVLVKQSIPLGAAGGTAGTGIGALAGLIVVMIFYNRMKPEIRHNMRIEEKGIYQETTGEAFKKLVVTAFPIIAGTAVFSMTNLIDMKMVMSGLMSSGAFTEAEAEVLYGQLSGKYVTLTTFPVSISSAMATAAIPNIAMAVTVGNKKEVKRKINTALKLAMIISIPAAVGIGVLGDQILSMLFPSYPEGGVLLKVGAISIAFLSFCQIVTGVLQGIGKIQVPVIGALLGAVVKIALNWILIRIPSINVVGAVISTDVCYLVASIFNVIMLMRYTKTRVNFSGVLIKPTIGSIIMGIGCVIGYKVISLVFGNTISTLLTIIVAVIIYLLVMIFIRGITEEDLLSIPKGRILVRVFKKIGLLK